MVQWVINTDKEKERSLGLSNEFSSKKYMVNKAQNRELRIHY